MWKGSIIRLLLHSEDAQKKANILKEELGETIRRHLAKAVRQIESGKFMTHEHVGKKLGLR
jgi:hypothetical protein